jgi:cation transport ATPase
MALTELGALEADPSSISGIQRIALDVTGMSCWACARRVEKTLNKIDGVRASVDFGSKVATIEAGRDISVTDLCDAVQNAGYGAKQRTDGIAESDDLSIRQKPGPLRTFIAAAMLFVRWLFSPGHR